MQGIWEDEIRSMQEEMDSLFDRFWRPSRKRRPLLQGTGTAMVRENLIQPLSDVFEGDNEIIAKIDMPGVDKDEIKVSATEDDLEVKAEKKSEKIDESKDMYRCERSYAGFYRRMSLPAKINPDKVSTEFKNGVLELKMPKLETGKRKVKQITVK